MDDETKAAIEALRVELRSELAAVRGDLAAADEKTRDSLQQRIRKLEERLQAKGLSG